MQDKIKTAKVVMGRAMQLQEHHMMQQREQEYNQALDQSMDDQRLQVPLPLCPCQSALAHLPLLHLPLTFHPSPPTVVLSFCKSCRHNLYDVPDVSLIVYQNRFF